MTLLKERVEKGKNCTLSIMSEGILLKLEKTLHPLCENPKDNPVLHIFAIIVTNNRLKLSV